MKALAHVWLPWQTYRASFTVAAAWRTVRIPLRAFGGYRIGVVVIGRAFMADLCLARPALYRENRGSE